MIKVRIGLFCAVAVTAAISPVAAQSAPFDDIKARCASAFFSEKDRAECVTRQTAAAKSFAPVLDFVLDGGYAVQTLHLGTCLERTKDSFGSDYVKLEACYDDAAKSGCASNQTCLANSTIAGIQTHIRNGTKP